MEGLLGGTKKERDREKYLQNLPSQNSWRQRALQRRFVHATTPPGLPIWAVGIFGAMAEDGEEDNQ